MANDMNFAIISMRTRDQINQATDQLEMSLQKMQRLLLQAVAALGAALNIRDPYTAGHQRKVVRLATAIAAEMGFSQEQIEGIAVAGNLHDIGKISVPSEILSKPGKLSDIEFAHIKTHPQAGYEIIKDIEFSWPIAEVLLQHHERINGSGYPRGLAGEEILIEARIIAVADVVEATASHRPYRPARGIETALDEIKLNKGILYDSDVVDACLRLFHEKGFKLE
jgi:HD-GYP domain-containing protein (c-di-GMP phosphodiesterase class II)